MKDVWVIVGQLTLQAVGGGEIFALLLWFFCNNSETRRDSDAKFRIASNEYLAHICAKFQICTKSGQVTVTSLSWAGCQIFASKL